MTKNEFMSQLRKQLSQLPEQDMEDRLNFYGEMIDDFVEEGHSEEEAIAEIASRIESEPTAEFRSQIQEIHNKNQRKDTETPRKRRKLKGWEIALIAITSPIWASIVFAVAITAFVLFISAVGIVFSLYAVLWSVVIAFWSIFVVFATSALAFVAIAPALAAVGKGLTGLALIGTALICAGLAIFLFFGSKAMSKGVFYLTKLPFLGIRKSFRKESSK